MALNAAATLAMARWWWTFLLRGLLAIVIGFGVYLSPTFGIAVLVGLFAAWALIDGAGSLLAGLRGRGTDRSWWLEVVEGLVSVAAGSVALLFPAFAAEVLVILFGAWAIVTGVVQIVTAVRLRDEISGEVWLGLAGVASILVGVLVLAYPAAGALSLVWLIGSFAVVYGAFLVLLGWRLRRIAQLAERDAAADSAA